MRSVMLAAALAATVLGVAACSSNDTAPTPTAPSQPSTPSTPAAPTGVITINVVRENGAQSFSPNPATVPAGQTVVWHNVDVVVHRVVLNDGKLDTGDIAAGLSARP